MRISTTGASRAVAGIMLCAVLGSSLLAPASAFALSDETETALSETQQLVEETAAAYEEAKANLDALDAQMEELQEQIDAIKAELPEAQEAASEAMVDLYYYQKGTNSFLSLLLNSTSFSDVITTLKYMEQIQEESNAAVDELNEMQAELEAAESELAVLEAAAEDEAKAAAEALSAAQILRQEAQDQAEAEEAAELAALAAAEAAAEEDEEESSSSSSTGTDSLNDENTATDTSVSSVTTSASSGAVDWTLSYDEFIEEWTARIDAYLEGSPLAGYGRNFAEAAWTYGVDPRWSPAIACIESSKGRYCFRSYNAWGWGSVSWSSWEEAIDAHVNGLSRLYGTTLTTAAAKKYCPPTWEDWYNKVAAQMNQI